MRHLHPLQRLFGFGNQRPTLAGQSIRHPANARFHAAAHGAQGIDHRPPPRARKADRRRHSLARHAAPFAGQP